MSEDPDPPDPAAELVRPEHKVEGTNFCPPLTGDECDCPDCRE